MNNNYLNNDREQIKKYLKIVLNMEWLGIHIDDVREMRDEYNLISKMVYYFSVPETSTIEVKEDKELNDKIKTADGLIELGKKHILDMVIDSCNDTFDDDDEELFEDVKNNISDYVKVYAKVRTGERWTKELGDAAVDKLINNNYKEV